MAYSNTGFKRPTEIIIKKTVGAGAPTVAATISLLDSFTYNSVPYPGISSDTLSRLSSDEYSTRFNALQSHINVDLQATYPGINLAFVEADFSVRDSNLCPI